MKGNSFAKKVDYKSKTKNKNKRGGEQKRRIEKTYIKLPPLHILPRLFTRNYNYQFGNLSPRHPLIQLCHNPLDIRLHLVVDRDYIFPLAANISSWSE